MSGSPIKVLIVEDSPSVQVLLTEMINADARLRVLDAVPSGEQALDFLRVTRPDVVLMDIQLPGISGFETTRRIMETAPLPIVICSAVADPDDIETTFQAMEAGALAVLPKPVSPAHRGFEAACSNLVDTLRLMSEVRLVRRRQRAAAGTRPSVPAVTIPPPERAPAPRLVAIGASTGGPPVLRTVLSQLPATLPVPVLIVQHIAAGFLRGLVDWLGQSCPMPMHIALHGEQTLPGHVYFAPDGFHLEVSPHGCCLLRRPQPGEVLCPSVGHLFQSVAAVHGAAAVAVLLTGMGRDGAAEMSLLKRHGAVTIAQDQRTSVVHGMPGEAIRLGGATLVLAAEAIPEALRNLLIKA